MPSYEIIARKFERGRNLWALRLVQGDDESPYHSEVGRVLVDQVGRRFRVQAVAREEMRSNGLVRWIWTFVRAEDKAFDKGPSKDIISDE